MTKNLARFRGPLFLFGSVLAVTALLFLPASGCKQSGHTSDPHLRQIDEMLDSQLPAGTPKSRVMIYLNSQGFAVENSNDPHSIVATVRHIDTETLQPVIASVTFHFDAEDKLKTYELVAR